MPNENPIRIVPLFGHQTRDLAAAVVQTTSPYSEGRSWHTHLDRSSPMKGIAEFTASISFSLPCVKNSCAIARSQLTANKRVRDRL